MSTRRVITSVFVLLTVFVLDALFGQTSREVSIPEGTRIRLSFDKALSSQTSQRGDRFTATVIESVSANNIEAVPKGSKLEGLVTVAKPAKKGITGLQHKEGELDVRWDSLVLPNGVRKEVVAHAVALDEAQNKAKVKDGEGTMQGESSTKRDVLQTGIGAGIGAAIGAIAGGGKGTAIGGAVGGLAGLGTAALRKGHELEIKEGTEITIQLDRPMNFVVRELANGGKSDLRNQRKMAAVQTRGGRSDEEQWDEEGAQSLTFSGRDARIIREFFSVPENLPPGLAKRGGNLSPGLKRQLVRRGHLPPGLQTRIVPFPVDLERQLPSLPESVVRVVLGRHALLLNEESNSILDVLYDVVAN